jgi:medium-chain acyl-[acyl-carrier-protein] hydrolase
MNPWFCRAGGVVDAPVRLFCFPPAGGSAAAFLPWQPLLGPGVELWAAELPGRGLRLAEPPLRDLNDLVAQAADAVAAYADRPFALFGHSLGALVAFEVARSLRRAGRPGPVSLWVAGAEGPRTRSVERQVHDLPDAELVAVLRDYGGTRPEVLADPELMELLMPMVRADLALSERYTYRVEDPLDVTVHVLVGDHDPYVDPARARGWSHESTRPIHRHVFAGGHFFPAHHQAGVTALIAADLAAGIGADR